MSDSTMSLQEAARIMGSANASIEEKRQAAKVMGSKGGANSHGGGRPRKNA